MALTIVINSQGPEPENAVYASGGTIRLIEILERLSKKPVTIHVLSSSTICNTLRRKGIRVNCRIIPFFIKGKSSYPRLLFDSILRTIRVSLSSPFAGKCVLYSPSDFLWDVFPAFVWKLRNRKAKWVICMFLIVPNLFRDYTKSFSKENNFSLPTPRRLLYYFSQQLAVSWGKRWAERILVLNNVDKSYLVRAKGAGISKVVVVNGGVDFNHIRSLRVQVKLFDGVFLGRFHPQKGIFDLIKIWKLVCDKKPDATLCIIGSGSASFVKAVKASIKENNLSNNVTLMGSKNGDEKFLLLKSSSVFLCPSYYESFAIVIAEAMACGLPVVAYDLPIYKDIYGENIKTVPLGDLDKFAGVIIQFLNNEELRRTFGLGGQAFVKRYDWDAIAEKEYQLMIDILDKA